MKVNLVDHYCNKQVARVKGQKLVLNAVIKIISLLSITKLYHTIFMNIYHSFSARMSFLGL